MRSRFNRLLPFVAGSVMLGVAPMIAMAQSGVLVGRVTSEEGTPLAGAEVRVSTVDGTVRTSADGTFRVAGLPSGLYYFGVRQLGYQPATDLLRFAAHDTLDVVLGRITATKKLDTIKVQARADASWEREMRRYTSAISASQFGTVITEEDIMDRRPIVTSDLFQTINGFSVMGGGGGARVVSSRGNCSPAIFLDGQLALGLRLNDITPQFIKIMVIFRGTSTVPIQFQDMRVNPKCGAIAIYTI